MGSICVRKHSSLVNTDTCFVGIEVIRIEKANVVGRDHRRARGARKIETGANAVFLPGAAGADQFEVEAVRKNGAPLFEKAQCRVLVIGMQRVSDITVQTARQGDQSRTAVLR